MLAYGPVAPWASDDALARLIDRYRVIGFNEIVCYAPTPDQRAAFEKVAGRLAELR